MNRRIPIIVCETQGKWAALLRPNLPAGHAIVETRSLADVWAQLGRAQAAVIALELSAERAEAILAALLRINSEYPLVVPLVLAEQKLVSWEDTVREAGAVHFVTSTRRLGEIAEIVRRQPAATFEGGAEGDSMTIEERILASLPWGR